MATRSRPSGDNTPRFIKSGYVILSSASWSRRRTTITELSLLARTATSSSYAPSNAWTNVGGNQRVMQLTRSLPKAMLRAKRLFSDRTWANNVCVASERSNEIGRRSSGWSSSLLSAWSVVSPSPARNALNAPNSPPQHTQPLRATKHLGIKDNRLTVSVSRVFVFNC